jgi:dCTP deaminase
MVLTGKTIKELNILSPCREKYKIHGISGGLSVVSYDVSLAEDLTFGPHDFKLASTEERFTMPLDVCGTVHDKSTWARIGLTVQTTFIDPGWSGYLTLEISNNIGGLITVNKGTPIAQIVFHRVESITEGYQGKYQNQESGPQAARRK